MNVSILTQFEVIRERGVAKLKNVECPAPAMSIGI
jgi:hypothetical protein